jgi:hypothetical protein
MAKIKAHYTYIIWSVIFIIYAFFAARPVGEETVLSLKWLTSLDSSAPVELESGNLVPFNFGGRYGYVDKDGAFTVNSPKHGYIEQSDSLFAEFSGREKKIAVNDSHGLNVFTMEDQYGYPFFRGERIFVIHSEQSSISEIDKSNNILWTYDFSSPLTCADASEDILVAGTIDGTIEIINKKGVKLYSGEPSGSRINAIYGCAASPSGTKAAVISGIDHQRFLVIEFSGGIWRITHHEFLGEGFRRPVFVKFVDGEQRIAYERDGGIAIYDFSLRTCTVVPLDGTIAGIDDYPATGGSPSMLFVALSETAAKKKLIAINYPGNVLLQAPFSGDSAFIKRSGSILFLGGSNKLAAFQIGKQ